MRHHLVEQIFVAELRIVQPEVIVRRAFLPEQGPHGNSHPFDHLHEQRAGRRRLKVFNDMRLNACVVNQAKGVARRSAVRVVIDDDVHGFSNQS